MSASSDRLGFARAEGEGYHVGAEVEAGVILSRLFLSKYQLSNNIFPYKSIPVPI
jgi:hypothetical protein